MPTVSVKDFGAIGNGIADDTAAVKAAIAAISQNQSLRGGTLYFPAGQYKLTDTLIFSSYAPDNAIDIMVIGDGWLSTWLDFSTMTGSKDCIRVIGDQQFSLSGFFLKGGAGTRDGIHFGVNAAEGGNNTNGASIFSIADIRVQGCGRHGIYHYNSYMGTMERVYALANGADGFNMAGYHTSLSFLTCYARSHSAGAGFRINGMVYSTFIGCGSDLNAFGYVGSNMRSTSFKSCGAEGNTQDGWLLFADNTGAPTEPLFAQECYDIHGVTLENCSGYGNNIGNAGYAGLLRVSATGTHSGTGTFNDGSPHKVVVSVRDCDANQSVAGTKAIVTQAFTGGIADVSLNGENYMPGGFTKGAGTYLRNVSLRGRKCRLSLSTDVAIANATATDVPWAVAADDIGGCWSSVTPTFLTIPPGVSRVRFTAATGWAGNPAGARRFLMLTAAGTFGVGYPRDDRSSAGYFNSTAFATGDEIDVTPGDQFKLSVEQQSGTALSLKANTAMLLMEVIE